MKIEIEKHVRSLVDQVVAIVEVEIARIVEATKKELIAACQGGEIGSRSRAISGGVTTAKRKVTRTRRARSVAHAGSSPAPDTKKPRKCGACGEMGHRADRCPNVTQSVPVVDRDIKPENIQKPPPVSKSDRFAAIEAAARARRGD